MTVNANEPVNADNRTDAQNQNQSQSRGLMDELSGVQQAVSELRKNNPGVDFGDLDDRISAALNSGQREQDKRDTNTPLPGNHGESQATAAAVSGRPAPEQQTSGGLKTGNPANAGGPNAVKTEPAKNG